MTASGSYAQLNQKATQCPNARHPLPLTSDRSATTLPVSFDRSDQWLAHRQTSSRAHSISSS
jgi:hypothetical protein